MNDKKELDQRKKLPQARAINANLVHLMQNRQHVENIAIAETRIENFIEDMDIVILDLGEHA